MFTVKLQFLSQTPALVKQSNAVHAIWIVFSALVDCEKMGLLMVAQARRMSDSTIDVLHLIFGGYFNRLTV